MQEAQEDIVAYYNSFYRSGDFSYYPRDFSRSVLASILAKCGVPPGARILDVGCGTGFYSSLFDELGFRVVGIDISDAAIEKACELHRGPVFEVGDATALRFPPGSFDFVFALGVSVANTRNMDQIHAFIRHLAQVIAPGGCLAFLGGSDLSGGQSPHSSWICHRWEELKEFIPDGPWQSEGPYLTHYRLLRLGPFVALNPLTTWILRFFGGKVFRKTAHFLHISRNTDC